MFVHSEDMIADIGTRRVDNLDAVNQNSVWINGFEWMRMDKAFFPARSIEKIKLDNEEMAPQV